MDLGIKGKTALVLSAGGGLGRAIAVAIAKEGASVAVTDIDENHLEATAAEIKKTGANVFTHPVDLANLPGLDDLVARITQKFGGVDRHQPRPSVYPLSFGSSTFNPWFFR
jgi:3-oxoacyl-[acyl-carrier protein] reductase